MSDSRPVFTTRRATARDAATLAELRDELFRELDPAAAARAPAGFAALCASQFAALLAGDGARAWLAQAADGASVGTAVLLLFPRLPTPALPPDREGYLLNVYTRPAWRGRGVASALVAAAVADARALGLARIRLHATAEGQPVYAAAGFRPRTDEMELRL
jgi:ribosomal protein S18 acetylase RimI-like enzyme